MGPRLKSLWLLLVQSICAFTAVDNSEILCKETYYVEVGNSALVSCEYDRSFYAVRWYFDGSEISFLRMDGTSKSGSGLTNGEFDITSDGSMVITDVQLKHEGTYTISVLDSSGVVSSKDLIVYATVLLKDLKVIDCKSSSADICAKLTSEQRETTLFCLAENSRPETELSWITTLQNKQNVVTSLPNYDASIDPTSLLHTSSSYIQYDKNSFVLEYFTCVVTGIAAQNANNVSLLLKGNAEFAEHTEDTKYVQKGFSFQVECPRNSFQSALLKVNYPNGDQKVLMTSDLNGRNRQCLIEANCYVGKDGLVTIDNVSFEDEGTYQCVFSDGVTSYAHDLNVAVVVPPSPAVTVIEECQDTLKCQRTTPLFGTLRCFLLGSKPTANLIFAVDQSSVNNILIFNIRNEVREAKEVGTLDTTLTAEYEIKECGSPIQITCKAESQVHNTIKSSTIILETDAVNCIDKQKSTSTAFVVLFIILLSVLLIGGIAILIFLRRKRGSSDEEKSKNDGEESKETDNFLPAKEQNQDTVKETNKNIKEGKQDQRKGEEHNKLLTEHKKATDPENKFHGKEDFQERDGEYNYQEEDKHQAGEAERKETTGVNIKTEDKPQIEKELKNNGITEKHSYPEEVKSQTAEAAEAKTIGVPHNYQEEDKHQASEAAKVETTSVNTTIKDKVELQRKAKVEKDNKGEDKSPKIGNMKKERKSEVSTESQDLPEKHEIKPQNSDVKINTEDKPQIEKELKTDAMANEQNYPEEVKSQAVEAAKAKTSGGSHNYREEGKHRAPEVATAKTTSVISTTKDEVKLQCKGEVEKDINDDKHNYPEEVKSQAVEAAKAKKTGVPDSQEEDVVQIKDVTTQNIETKKQYFQKEDSHEGKDEVQNKTSDAKKSNSETVEDILKRFDKNTHQPVQTILKYVRFSTVEDTSDTKILYIYFLQICFRRYHESTKNSRFKDMFCTILQNLTEYHEKKKGKEPEGEKLSEIFLKILLCSVEWKKIDRETCTEILAEEIAHNTIERKEYYHAIKNCLQENWLSTETSTDILLASLEKDLITQENFVSTLKSQRKAEQMTQENFLITLKFAVANKQLSTSKFTDILSESLSEGLISQPTFLTALESLLTAKQISKDIFKSTLFGKLKEDLIPADLFVSNMHSLLAKDRWNL